MQLDTPPSRNNSLVSMTPLIDVVFILLLFFMLVSNFQQWRGMPLNLAGQQNNPEQQSRLIGVQIGRYGELTLNNTPVTLDTLTAMLATQIAAGTDPEVLIETDPSTDLQMLVTVIDRISAVGINQITLGGNPP